MSRRNLVYFVSTILVLSSFTAWASQAKTREGVVTNSPNSTVKQTLVPNPELKSRPSKKTVPDQWTQKPIPVTLFGTKGFPFTTYYPESDFIVQSKVSGAGMGVWFYSKLEGKKYDSAYVHVVFPAKPPTLEGMRREVIGKNGMMETNNWRVKSRSRNLPYRWAKERIDFEQLRGNTSIMGTVYIGEYKRRAFLVTEHFPADYGDGFAPRASIILKELQLKN